MDSPWTCVPALTAAQRLEVLDLINRTETALGREALDETRRRTVVHGGTAEHWLLRRDELLMGYALVQGQRHSTLEMCGGGWDEALLARVLEHHECVDWWTRDSVGVHDNAVRTLQLLTRDLPVDLVHVPVGARLRTFEQGRDEMDWLAQNNAAFASHPEQGEWSAEDLAERIAEPWFDPSGFLILEWEGRLAASCWTKVHELSRERLGEIYVISVDPDFQGHGLGRVMLSQGLHSLRQRGVRRAVLFVDADNVAAQHLYRDVGFTLEREDQLLRFRRG